jgi:hypothetical protein
LRSGTPPPPSRPRARLGVLERDGVAVATAYGFLVLTIIYFAVFAGVLVELTQMVLHELGF